MKRFQRNYPFRHRATSIYTETYFDEQKSEKNIARKNLKNRTNFPMESDREFLSSRIDTRRDPIGNKSKSNVVYLLPIHRLVDVDSFSKLKRLDELENIAPFVSAFRSHKAKCRAFRLSTTRPIRRRVVPTKKNVSIKNSNSSVNSVYETNVKSGAFDTHWRKFVKQLENF